MRKTNCQPQSVVLGVQLNSRTTIHSLPFPSLAFTRMLKTATKLSWSWRVPKHPLVPAWWKSNKKCACCRLSPMASIHTRNVFGTKSNGWVEPAASLCCQLLSPRLLELDTLDVSSTLSYLSLFWGRSWTDATGMLLVGQHSPGTISLQHFPWKHCIKLYGSGGEL